MGIKLDIITERCRGPTGFPVKRDRYTKVTRSCSKCVRTSLRHGKTLSIPGDRSPRPRENPLEAAGGRVGSHNNGVVMFSSSRNHPEAIPSLEPTASPGAWCRDGDAEMLRYDKGLVVGSDGICKGSTTHD